MLMSLSMSFIHMLLFTCSCTYEQLNGLFCMSSAGSVLHVVPVVSGLQLCSCAMGVAIGQSNNILSFSLFLLQVWCESNEEEEEEEEESEDLKGSIAFCLQVEHTGIRTYYFSADSQKEQEEWIQALSEAARVHVQATSRYTHIYNPHSFTHNPLLHSQNQQKTVLIYSEIKMLSSFTHLIVVPSCMILLLNRCIL